MDNGSSPLRQRLIGWGRQLKPILLALGFVLIVRTVVAEPYRVPSPSIHAPPGSWACAWMAAIGLPCRPA